MSDDYLWNGTGTPDPDVERLERLLGRLRTTAPVPEVRRQVRLKPDTTYEGRTTYAGRTLRFLGPALAAAAATVVMVGLTWQARRDAAAWDVARLDGTPRIGSTPLSGEGRFAVGQTLTTDAASRARIEVSTIGQVDVDGDTRVRLVSTRDGHHQLALERGTLHAIITAPPGQFIVDTPSATATDLGCVYDLHVNDDGSGLLSVVAGLVAFEDKGRESFVPAGASCPTDPTRGPGTPRYDDEPEALRNALDEFDYGGDGAHRAAALRFVIDHPDTSAVTLWHLIPRVGAPDRGAVVDALADQLPMPPGVTREAILRLDRAALDAWWNELGLGDASWWRKWKGPIPATGAFRSGARD
jgi:hypothetical protein